MADNSSASKASDNPRTRQRAYKPPPVLEVPDIDEDAPERKRILNVLAQRRYREKKRQRRLRENKDKKQPIEHGAEDSNEPTDVAIDGEGEDEIIGSSDHQTDLGDLGRLDLSLNGWDGLNDSSLTSMLPDIECMPNFLGEDGSGEESLGFSNPGAFPEIMPVNFRSPSTFDNVSSSSSDVGFPDSYLLPVHELTLFRAIFRIAERLGAREELWNLAAISPFNRGIATPADELPLTWRPTESQILLPHHPVLDFLPWPGVRDRVIRIFSLPDAMRPPNAKGPLALVNFVYDFENNSEGVRIYGADPYDEKSWEIGQIFFERWWFLFDRNIIENSNRWRRLRGAPPLALKGPQ